jgi:hypothetical protein
MSAKINLKTSRAERGVSFHHRDRMALIKFGEPESKGGTCYASASDEDPELGHGARLRLR